LPPEGTPYPFVYLGEFQQDDTTTKRGMYGNVYATIHIWHNDTKRRGTLSRMMLDVKMECCKVERTANCSFSIATLNSRIIPDNTTKTPLLHAVIEAGFSFT
jgi:hypothetical protein